jgi:hypothetical protein
MRQIVLRLFKILPGAPLAVLIGVASVSPEDALPNIAKWAKFLGFEKLPSWLTDALIDSRVFWSASIALATYVIFLILVHYVPKRPIIAISGLLVIVAPIISWILVGISSASLFMECDFGPAPKVFRSDGNIYNITISSAKQIPAFGRYFGPAGGEFKISNDFLEAYQCSIVNYSGAPVLNVDTVIRIVFMAPVSNGPGSQTGGDIIGSNDAILQIPRIDIGPERAFIFYVFNLSGNFVRLGLPQVASYQWSGSKIRRTAQFDQPSMFSALFLSPAPHPLD